MSVWHITAGAVALLAIGIIRQVSTVKKASERHSFVSTFLEEFANWCIKKGEDQETYTWLITKSGKMQNSLGRAGRISHREPFSMYISHTYPVILNGIPELHKMFSSGRWRHVEFERDNIDTFVRTISACLLRHRDYTKDVVRNQKACLRNPFRLFFNGAAWVIALPLLLLSELKIITPSQQIRIVQKRSFSILSGIVTLLSLTAAIMTIIMGLEGVKDIISKLITP